MIELIDIFKRNKSSSRTKEKTLFCVVSVPSIQFKMTSNKNIYNQFPLKCTNIRQKKRGISFPSSCSLRFSLVTCFGRFITDFVDGRLMTAMAEPRSYRQQLAIFHRILSDVWVGRSPISRSTFSVFLGILVTRKTA